MKNSLLMIVILLWNCSNVETSNSATSMSAGTSDIPAGAEVVAYEDSPSLEKVALKDASGSISLEGTVLDGKRSGAWTEYHPNGLVKTITSYVNGMREGLQVELSTNGQLEKRSMFHKDQLHGPYREYRYNTVKEERFYNEGKLEGTTKVYYDNGKIMEEGAYRNGTRDGISRWYDQEGNVTIEYEYKNGELVKK